MGTQYLGTGESLNEKEHRTHFAGRTECVIQEGQQLFVGPPFAHLPYVARNRARRLFHLVPATRQRAPVILSRPSVIAHRSSLRRHPSSALGHRCSVIGHRPSVIVARSSVI